MGYRENVPYPRQYREKAYKLLAGAHVQQATDPGGKEYSRKLLEVGLHRTLTATYGYHPPPAFTHGLSVEVAPVKEPIFGFKYGAWAVAYFFALGISAVYYTDFDKGNLKIRPEFGLGGYPFKLTFGYNIPTFNNADFEALRRSDFQLTLNILLKLKTIERQEW